MEIGPKENVWRKQSWRRMINGKLFAFHATWYANGVLQVVVDEWSNASFQIRRVFNFEGDPN